HQPAVGTEAHLIHDIFEGNELLNVDIGLVLDRLGRRVKVDVLTCSLRSTQVLDQSCAECGLERVCNPEGARQYPPGLDTRLWGEFSKAMKRGARGVKGRMGDEGWGNGVLHTFPDPAG